MSSIRGKLEDIGVTIKGLVGIQNEKLALAILEGLVLRIFDQFSQEQLYGAIVDNRNIFGENWGKYEKYRDSVMMLAQDPKYVKYRSYLTVENMLEWLRAPDGKPDFASIIINTPGGAAWLECQIDCLLEASNTPMQVNRNV